MSDTRKKRKAGSKKSNQQIKKHPYGDSDNGICDTILPCQHVHESNSKGGENHEQYERSASKKKE